MYGFGESTRRHAGRHAALCYVIVAAGVRALVWPVGQVDRLAHACSGGGTTVRDAVRVRLWGAVQVGGVG